jgi:hypothetical protein
VTPFRPTSEEEDKTPALQGAAFLAAQFIVGVPISGFSYNFGKARELDIPLLDDRKGGSLVSSLTGYHPQLACPRLVPLQKANRPTQADHFVRRGAHAEGRRREPDFVGTGAAALA